MGRRENSTETAGDIRNLPVPVTEGEPRGDDFLFFGFVNGLDSEFGYFCLSELESAKGPLGFRGERDLAFQPGKLTDVVPAPDV